VKGRPKFDLDAELKSAKPRVRSSQRLFEQAPVRDWFERLAALYDKGGCSQQFIADTLTKGARVEGLIPPTHAISCAMVQRMLKARS
jgi:hypothetical protein